MFDDLIYLFYLKLPCCMCFVMRLSLLYDSCLPCPLAIKFQRYLGFIVLVFANKRLSLISFFNR